MTTDEIKKQKVRRRKRKKPALAPDMGVHRRLAYSASEKLRSGKDLSEEELIALFKADTLSQQEVEAAISQVDPESPIRDLINEFRYVEPPEIVISCANLWCPSIEQEMLEYFQRNPGQLYTLNSRVFEEVVAAVFRNNGFKVELTPATHDGGVDLIAVQKSELVGESVHLIECKRYGPKHKVGIGVVQRLLGAVAQRRANKGIVVTTSFFSREARAVAQETRHMLALKDYNDLCTWLSSLRLTGEE